MTKRLTVAALGARGPLGTTPLQLAMAARARRLVPKRMPWSDRRGRSMGACPAVGVELTALGYERLLQIGAPAAWQAAVAVEEPLPLFLALAERGRADDDPRLDDAVLVDLAARAALPLDRARSRVFRAGHAGGALALQAALALFAEPVAPAALLVGGIDSWLHPEVLRGLDADGRLHRPDGDEGFIPGEGAAFLLLRAGEDGPRVRAAVADREDTVTRDDPNLARAMTALMHDIVALAGKPIHWVMSDVNGERFRDSEWGKVRIRTLSAEGAVHQRVPDFVGDVGAATGPLAVVLACSYWQTGCAPDERVVVALHSEGAERGAILVEAS